MYTNKVELTIQRNEYKTIVGPTREIITNFDDHFDEYITQN